MYHSLCERFRMSRVALVVVGNSIIEGRLRNIMSRRGWSVEICQDGDKAVDEYIRLDPELVIISLDIPSLDGHLTALEMREHGGDARIVFVAPRRLATVAADAKFSAGAVAWLQKPITKSVLDEQWDTILGKIPEAPGLEDLDELYPIDRIKPEEDDGPMPLPALPGMPLTGLPGIETGPLPPVEELPQLEVQLPISNEPSPKKSKKGKIFFVIILLGAAAAGYYAYSTNLI